MNETVWLLDLDGVLNFFGPSAWPSTDEFRVAFGGTSFRIRYSPEMITGITTLALDAGIDVRLCSTWCEEPQPILSQLGLSVPNAFTPLPGDNLPELKLRAALDVVRSGSRLIWTDDDAIPTDGLPLEELLAADSLLIAPNEMLGLTPADLDRIAQWAGADDEV